MSIAQDVRLKHAISGFVGPNGSGKSLMCALDTMLDLDDGVPVLSTMRFLDWRNRRPCDDAGCSCDKTAEDRHFAAHPLYTPWVEWDQFMDWSFGVVVADEIMGVASSTDRSDLPQRVMKRMQKMRHFDLTFRWTGPAWARADITLREITQLVTVCSGSFKVRASDHRRRWRQARLIKANSYDVGEIVDFRVQSRDKLQRVGREWLWIPRSDARLAYDTYDAVFEVGTADHGGRCDDCGRRIRQEYCKCDHSRPAAQAGPVSSELVSANGPDGDGGPDGAVLDPGLYGDGSVPRRLVLASSLLDGPPPLTLADVLPAEAREARRNGRPYR